MRVMGAAALGLARRVKQMSGAATFLDIETLSDNLFFFFLKLTFGALAPSVLA